MSAERHASPEQAGPSRKERNKANLKDIISQFQAQASNDNESPADFAAQLTASRENLRELEVRARADKSLEEPLLVAEEAHRELERRSRRPEAVSAQEPANDPEPPSEEPAPEVTPEPESVPETTTPEIELVPVEKIVEELEKRSDEEDIPPGWKKGEKRSFDLGVVDVTELAEVQARDRGDARMTESAEDRSKNFITRNVKRIWKHNMFQEYYRQKEIAAASKEIYGNKDLYAGEGMDKIAHEKAMGAILERFTADKELQEAGVLRDGEEATRNPMDFERDLTAQRELKEAINRYASDPEYSEEAFAEERNRLLSGLHPDYAKKNTLFADNLLTIAKEVKSAVEAGASLSDLDYDINLIRGKARESLQSETNMNFFDRAVEKMQNNKIGRFLVNEPLAMLAAAGTVGLLQWTGTTALRSTAAKAVTFGGAALAAGGITALKESARIHRERIQHMRERAKGKRFEGEDMERRKEMEETIFETTPARAFTTTLTQRLEALQNQEATKEDIESAVSALAAVESRIAVADEKKGDLISYSGFDTVERERTDLDLARAKLKIALRTHGDDVMNTLMQRIENIKVSLIEGEEGTSARNTAFRSLKTRKVASAFVTSALLSAGIGGALSLAGQEIAAIGSDHDGVIGGLIHGAKDSTAHHVSGLESARRWITGDHPRMALGTPHEQLIGNTHIAVPEGVEMTHNPDGSYTLATSGSEIAEHVKLDVDDKGLLTKASQEALAKLDIHTDTSYIDGTAEKVVHQSASEYVNEHVSDTTPVHRELFYDNDTPHPFDKNEMREWWGGNNGTGIDKDGNYVMSMQHMTANGSYHDGATADAHKLIQESKLVMLFSISEGTQHRPFALPIMPDGSIVIPKGSELAKHLFEQVQGHAMFTGKFAEIAERVSVNPDGSENMHILSTVTGKGHDTIDVTRIVTTHVPRIKLDMPGMPDLEAYIPSPTPRRALEGEEPKRVA